MYKFAHRISELTDKLGTLIFLPAMVAIITLDVVMRYLLKDALVWSQEVTGMLLFMFFFAIQGNCFEGGHHIRMDIVYNHYPLWAKKLTTVISCVSGMLFFGLIGLQGVLEIPYMLKVNETSDELRLPLWPFRVFMVFCCLQMVLLLISTIFKPVSQSRGH
jgi:TRAP-type C4-dicarboxylate transport system permease small subunit